MQIKHHQKKEVKYEIISRKFQQLNWLQKPLIIETKIIQNYNKTTILFI